MSAERARRELRNALRLTMYLLEEDGRSFGWLESMHAAKASIDRAFTLLDSEEKTPPTAIRAWRRAQPEPEDDEGR